MNLPVAILAGGLATRMRPMTASRPKALLEVAGRPFIAWQLDQLSSHGIRQVVLCTGHLGEQIEAYVGNGDAFGLKVSYAQDGPALLGTGGALRAALPLLGRAFFVLYGDSYLTVNYAAVASDFLRQKKPALMTVLRNEGQWGASNVVFENGQLLKYDKFQAASRMKHIDYGLSVLTASVFETTVCDGPSDLAEVLGALSDRGELAGYEVTDRFYEIGSPQGLQETVEFLRRERT